MTSSDNSKHKLIRVLTEFNYYNKYPWLEDEELIPIVKNMLKKNENYTTTTSQEIDVDISMEMYEFTTKADLEEAKQLLQDLQHQLLENHQKIVFYVYDDLMQKV